MARLKRSVEKEVFWRFVLDEQASSGLSVRAFCRREAVSEASFYFWRRELAARDGQARGETGSPVMIPVRVVEAEQTSKRSGDSDDREHRHDSSLIEVRVPGGFTLRASGTTDADQVTAWLGAILRAQAS